VSVPSKVNWLAAGMLLTLNRYVRALEGRILELESQFPGENPECFSTSRQTPAQEIHRRGDGTLSRKRPFERTTLEDESDSLPRDPPASRRPIPSTIAQDETSSTPQRMQHPVRPECAAPYPSLSLPVAHAVGDFPDPQGRCGHASLLIGILATLTSANPIGLSSIQADGPNAPTSPPFTNQLFPSDRSSRISDELSDQLVQIYLERVNPRYPFLHPDTFLEWYKAWKAQSHMDTTGHQRSLWKDYFVTMVRKNPVQSNIRC
jgi:hypothetical protein